MSNVLEVSLEGNVEPNVIRVTWELTRNCNYRCSYCSFFAHENYFSPKKVLDFLTYLNTKKKIDLVLFGGECSSHPEFLDVLKKLKDLNLYNVSIFTNLSFDFSKLKKIFDMYSFKYISVSYHPSRSNLNEFLEKMRYIKSLGVKIGLNFMWDRSRENLIDDLNEIKKVTSDIFQITTFGYMSKIEIENTRQGKMFFINGKRYKIIYKNKGKIKEKIVNEDFFAENSLTNFKFFKCSAGREYIYIGSDGKVYSCFSSSRSNIWFLDINKDDFSKMDDILNKDTICFNNICRCDLDLTKKRITF